MVTAITGLETGIVQLGGTTATTLGGEAASSFTFDLGTETNIDSTFAFAGGLNNMNTLVNTDGVPGVGQTVATTITVIDPEATEIASQTFGVTDVNDNNVDSVGNFINDAINNNTEAPIDFVSEYGSAVVTAVAQEAGNTNPFTIVINNNGATPANAGNLSTTSVQSGELINQIETLKVRTSSGNTLADISQSSGEILFQAPVGFSAFGTGAILLGHNLPNELTMVSLPASSGVIFNASRLDRDFTLRKQTTGDAYKFDASEDVTTIDSDTINFVANTITGLPDTTVTKAAVDTAIGSGTLDTDYYASDKTWRTLPTGATPTTVLGTANEIDVATVTSTATVSLSSTITDAIDANTAKVSNVDLLPLQNNWTNTNVFNSNNADLDFIIRGNTSGNVFSYNGGTDDVLVDATGFSAFGSGALILGHNLPNDLTMTSTPTTGVIWNASRLDRDFVIRKETTGEALAIDAGADTITIGSDVLTINSTTINGLPDPTKTQVDTAIGSGTLTTDYYASDKTWKSIPSGGTATTVQGTSGQIGVNTVGNTATVSLDTAITSAITANTSKTGITTAQATAITNNTAKTGITTAQASAITTNTSKVGITTAQATAITNNTAKTGITTAQASAITANTAKVSVAGLNQVGAAVLSTDSVVYYAGTALAPRRKVFSSVPLSIFNNDAGFSTSSGTVTSVTGTANQINVATGTTTPVVSLNNTITSAITANTSKVGITQHNLMR